MSQTLKVKDRDNANLDIIHVVPGTTGAPSPDVLSVQLAPGAAAVPVSGPLTDAALRASAVPVSIATPVAVTGPATNAELRASALPVSGPLTDVQLRAAAVPVSGPLTDSQVRATPLPVAVPGSVAVTGPATNAELRATPLSVATTPTNGALADRSGTITTANTAQNAIAANASRRGFSIQNLHATDPLYFNQSGTATTGIGSTKLAAGAYFESPVGAAGVAAISVLSATATHPFTAKEW